MHTVCVCEQEKEKLKQENKRFCGRVHRYRGCTGEYGAAGTVPGASAAPGAGAVPGSMHETGAQDHLYGGKARGGVREEGGGALGEGIR